MLFILQGCVVLMTLITLSGFNKRQASCTSQDVLVIYTLVGSIHHFLDKRINSNFFLRMWVISVSRTLGK